MTGAELQSLLTVCGIPSRVSVEEVQVETCMFCGNDRWNLELNADRGVYHCWTCKSGGRLDVLVRKLTGKHVDIPYTPWRRKTVTTTASPDNTFQSTPVSSLESAAHYLAQRGIDIPTAMRYGIAVCTTPGHRLYGRLVLPALDYWTGLSVGWIGRSYTGQQPKYLSTMVAKQIIGWRNQRAPVVALVEGLLDGIAVHRAGAGAAVLAGTSSPDALEWASRLDAHTRVVIMLDADASEISRRLYWELKPVLGERITRVELPEGDPATVGPTALRQYLA